MIDESFVIRNNVKLISKGSSGLTSIRGGVPIVVDGARP